VSNTLFDQFD